jgi:hypothetical protein
MAAPFLQVSSTGLGHPGGALARARWGTTRRATAAAARLLGGTLRALGVRPLPLSLSLSPSPSPSLLDHDSIQGRPCTARRAFRLQKIAAPAAATPSPFQVSIQYDNRASHIINNDKAVTEELAKELCFTDKAKVTTARVFDESSALNTQSRGVYACFPGKYRLSQMLDYCNKSRYRNNFYDEIGDRTSPDIEAERYQCTLCDTNNLTVAGPCFAKTSARLAAEKPPRG